MKMKKKIAIIMTLYLIISSVSISFSANAEGKITQEAIAAVMSMYNLSGSNKYWTYDSTVSGASTAWTGSDHYASSSSSGQWRQYDSGDFFMGWQCYGFAEFMGWAVTCGTSKNDVPLRSSSWMKYYSKSAYLAAGGLEVGDIIHYWDNSTSIGHSVMIYEVLSNGKFKVVEALGSVGNKINWGWVEGYESHSTLSYFDSNKGAWQYGLKYKGNTVIEPETYETLEFRNIAYPKTFKIDTTNGWFLQDGAVVSDVNLTSIRSIITRLSDNKDIDDTGEISISGRKYFAIKSIDAQVKFSNINSAGKYAWRLIAKDSNGRTLRMVMYFDAVSSGSTSTEKRATLVYPNSDTWDGGEYHEFQGNTNGSTTFYVNSSAANSYIYLKSQTGTACVNQHTLGISSGQGNETHHGFYTVSISKEGRQDNNSFIWAPSATTNKSGISTNEQVQVTFPSTGYYRVEVNPMSNSDAAKYWKVDSIDHWVTAAKWYCMDTKSNCTVSNTMPTIEFSLSSGGDGVPSGSLPKGKSYELRGVVSASENIKSVMGTIYDANTGETVSGIGTNPITINPNNKSVDIFTSQVNYSLKFNLMNDGAYRYELVVTTVSGLIKTVANSTFIIGNGNMPIPTVEPTPPPFADVFITSVTLDQKTASLQIGESVTLNAAISPGNVTNKTLQWKSSNTSVATVDSSGNVNAVNVGNATISVSSSDGTGVMDTCRITVSPQLSSPDFILPTGLKNIEEEAFAGLGFKEMYIRLPEGLEQIGSRAFADYSKKLTIYIPASVTSIHDRAFENTNVLILCKNGSPAQQFAERKGYSYFLVNDLSDWVLATNVPENAEIANTKTQYSFRDRGAASYSEWSTWSAWTESRKTITDSSLMQEESKTQCRWWAAKCFNCGHNNPYHATSCKTCGAYLDSNKEGTVWTSVFTYSDDTSGTSTILGRSQGRYFDGEPYWNEYKQVTAYRYRTRELTYSWSGWSAWSDTPVTATETRQVQTRLMVQYLMN